MTFEYTKYGIINALWSLVPIFPTWTLFPGILTAIVLESGINDCELSFKIVLWASIILTIMSAAFFLKRLKSNKGKCEANSKTEFRLWSLLIYTLINTAGLILIVGINLACHGDGQTVLACFYSGPIASSAIVIFGLSSDLKIKKTSANST